jgi:hypothetical protein
MCDALGLRKPFIRDYRSAGISCAHSTVSFLPSAFLFVTLMNNPFHPDGVGAAVKKQHLPISTMRINLS